MKINDTDYAELRAAISQIVPNAPALKSSYAAQGLPDRRLAFDVFHGAMALKGTEALHSRLYEYLNDSSIETAVRNILNHI